MIELKVGDKVLLDLWTYGHRMGIFYEYEMKVEGQKGINYIIESARDNLVSFRELSKSKDKREYQFYFKEMDICILEDKVILGFENAYEEVTEYTERRNA